ncbi:MAG: alpha/beta fold hydrolase, partial [Myxococcota bacterium]
MTNFEGFEHETLHVNGSVVNLVRGGRGDPLLLLHGYPQTHAIWHKIAGTLSKHFTVVCADLRGYGDSAKPVSDEAHAAYAKRAMADDLVAAMEELGHERYHVAGHDRGGRVGHRLAADHPERVLRLSVLDIAPTYTMYTTTDMAFAQAY